MRGDDLRGIGAVRESDMVGPATESFPVAGPTVTAWSRGSRESEHRVHRLLEIGDDVVGVLDAAAQTHQIDADAGLL